MCFCASVEDSDACSAERVCDVQRFRLQLSEAAASTESAEAAVRKLQGELEEAQRMISTLEEDLQAAEDTAVGNSPTEQAATGPADTSSVHAALDHRRLIHAWPLPQQ